MTQPKIYVAGHRGLVGSAIVRALEAKGYGNLVTRPRSELPLDDAQATDAFFTAERPDWVFLAAAKVGGILANVRQPADFIRDNLRIQGNVIDAAYRHGASRLLFLSSNCVYPSNASQPIAESAMLTGPLEPTNSAYAVAKIAGTEMCNAYRKQFGMNAFTVVPPNIYGIGDNYNPETSNVVAGMIRRMHEANLAGAESATVWGSGTPLRELIFSEDLADACVFLMESYEDGGMINAGTGQDLSIADLAAHVKAAVGFEGELQFDVSKPDGIRRKLMDSGRLFDLGWRPRTDMATGLASAYRWFLENEAASQGRAG